MPKRSPEVDHGEAGRDPAAITGAMYMSLRIDDDVAAAEARIGAFLEAYYPGRGEQMTRVQAWYAGDASGAVESLAAIRGELGWSSGSSIIAPK